MASRKGAGIPGSAVKTSWRRASTRACFACKYWERSKDTQGLHKVGAASRAAPVRLGSPDLLFLWLLGRFDGGAMIERFGQRIAFPVQTGELDDFLLHLTQLAVAAFEKRDTLLVAG